MNYYHSFIAGLLYISLLQPAFAQTVIWEEDFTSYADGTTDPGDGKWLRDVTGANVPPGHFEVNDNGIAFGFEAYDTEAWVTWQSEFIDVSSYTKVYINSLLSTSGASDADTIQLYYRLNNGPEVLGGTLLGAFINLRTFNIYSLQADSIQLIVKANTNNNGFVFRDYMRLESISVVEQNVYFSVTDGSLIGTNTWSLDSTGCPCVDPSDPRDFLVVRHNVTVNSDLNISGMEVRSSGNLQWGGSYDLTFDNSSSLSVASGGQFNSSGHSSTIYLDDNFSTFGFYVDGTLIMDNLAFNNQETELTLSGSGTISMDNFLFDNNSDNSVINNYAVTTISSGLTTAGNNGRSYTWNNFIGSTLTMSSGSFDMNNEDMSFHNWGVFNAGCDFDQFDSGSDFYNYSGAVWNFSGSTFDSNFRLHADYGTNNFNYTGSSQEVVDPVDAYSVVSFLGSGTKTSVGNLAVNGNMTIYSGVTIDFSSHTLAIEGSSNQTLIDQTGTLTVDDFVVNKSGGALYLYDATDTTELNILSDLILTSGIIHNSDNGLITVAGNISGGSSSCYVNGPLRKTTTSGTPFSLPIGDGAVYAPLMVDAVYGLTSASYTARYYDVGAPNQGDLDLDVEHVSDVEYWNIDYVGDADSTDVTFHWMDASRSQIIDLPDLIIAHFDSGTGQWEDVTLSGAVDLGGGTGSISGRFTSFSPGTFGSSGGGNPLPVELVNFDGHMVEHEVELNWATATELNNDHFVLEKSADGLNFYPIHRVDGAGTTFEAQYYQFIDVNPLPRTTYYRLIQIDFDGTSTTSNVIAVHADDFVHLSSDMTIFPNPIVNHQLTVELQGILSENSFDVRVIDMSGRKVFSTNRLFDNMVQQTFKLPPLNPGQYLLVLTGSENQFSKRFIIR